MRHKLTCAWIERARASKNRCFGDLREEPSESARHGCGVSQLSKHHNRIARRYESGDSLRSTQMLKENSKSLIRRSYTWIGFFATPGRIADSDGELRIADRELRIADCDGGLWICGWRMANCGLRIAACRISIVLNRSTLTIPGSIRNSYFAVRNPQFAIRNPKPSIRNSSSFSLSDSCGFGQSPELQHGPHTEKRTRCENQKRILPSD